MNDRALVLLAVLFFMALQLRATPAERWKACDGDPVKLEAVLLELDSARSFPKDSLMQHFRYGYETYLRSGFAYGQGLLLYRIGLLYLEENMFSAADDTFAESVKLFEGLEAELPLAKAYSAWGTALGRKGEYDEATTKLMTALKVFERLSDEIGASSTYLKLGTVHSYLSDFPKALDYYQRSLELALINDRSNVVTLYANIGFIYLELKDYDKSEASFQKALEHVDDCTSRQPIALAYINLGQLYLLQGRQEEGLAYLAIAEDVAEKNNLIEELLGIELVKINHSSLEAQIKSRAKLIELKEKASKFEMHYLVTEILAYLIQLEKRQGNYQQALAWTEERVDLQNRLFNERKARDIANLQSAYQLEKSKEEIGKLNEKILADERYRLLIWSFVIVLAIGILVTLYFYYRARNSNRLLKFREVELSNAIQMQDRLFAIIGHDLKNAISSQPVVLELLKTVEEDADREGLLEGLEASINDVLYVLDTLLNWGRMQFQGVSVMPTAFNAWESVSESIRLLDLSARLKEIHIENQIPHESFVYVDQDQFRFVSRNLLSNAIKYSKRGGRVVFSAAANSESGELLFCVRDFGVGMSADQLNTVFNIESKSTPGTANELGHGIALVLSREFVTKNGGRIWVESELGVGSSFYFSLPMANESQLLLEQNDADASKSGNMFVEHI